MHAKIYDNYKQKKKKNNIATIQIDGIYTATHTGVSQAGLSHRVQE